MDDLTRAVGLLRPLVADGAEGGAEQRLARHGWRLTDVGRRLWSSEGFVGQLFPGLGRDDTDQFDVTLLARPGDGDDGDDGDHEERCHEEFTALFGDGVERLRPVLGEPGFVGEVGQDGFPEEIDAAMLALWQTGAGGLFLAYMHEDSGLPFRIVVIVDLAGRQPPRVAVER